MSSEDLDVKLNINSRSLSVYEQYLKQVTQNIAREQQSRDPSEYSTTSSSSDADEAFVRNFSDRLHDSPVPASDASLVEQANAAANYEPMALNQSARAAITKHTTRTIEPRAAKPKQSSSNGFKLLMVVAAFCTLLLLAVVVIVFNANNSLVALTDRLSSVNNQMSAVNNNISVIGKENSLANAKAVEDERIARAANEASLASVKESLTSIAINTEPEKRRPVAAATTRVRSMRIGETAEPAASNEAPISYKDFTEESEVTVYRESSY